MSADSGAASRKPLVLIFLFSAAPFILATLIYLFWKPAPDATVGVYLNPTAPLSAPALRDLSGMPAPLEQLRGRWLLLMVSDAACSGACGETLFRMQQWRMAQGEKMNRIERVWLQTGPTPATSTLPAAAGVIVRHDAASELARQLPAASSGQDGAIYLLDPHGNLVMRYDASADPVKVIRELTRLLKINNRLG